MESSGQCRGCLRNIKFAVKQARLCRTCYNKTYLTSQKRRQYYKNKKERREILNSQVGKQRLEKSKQVRFPSPFDLVHALIGSDALFFSPSPGLCNFMLAHSRALSGIIVFSNMLKSLVAFVLNHTDSAFPLRLHKRASVSSQHSSYSSISPRVTLNTPKLLHACKTNLACSIFGRLRPSYGSLCPTPPPAAPQQPFSSLSPGLSRPTIF